MRKYKCTTTYLSTKKHTDASVAETHLRCFWLSWGIFIAQTDRHWTDWSADEHDVTCSLETHKQKKTKTVNRDILDDGITSSQTRQLFVERNDLVFTATHRHMSTCNDQLQILTELRQSHITPTALVLIINYSISIYMSTTTDMF